MTERAMPGDAVPSRRKELLTFAALAFGFRPPVAVGVVGGYRSLVWMRQTVFGPPAPPTHGVF